MPLSKFYDITVRQSELFYIDANPDGSHNNRLLEYFKVIVGTEHCQLSPGVTFCVYLQYR
jgi:hypothetical protein